MCSTSGEALIGRARHLISRAQMIAATGRRDECIAYLRDAIAVTPRPAPLVYAAGVMAYKLGFFVESAAWFRRAIKLGDRRVSVRLQLGLALAGYGRTERALVELSRASALDPHSTACALARAEAAWRVGSVALALECIDNVLRREPNSNSALLARAAVEASVGHVDIAAITLRDLLRRDPACWSAWIALSNLKTVPIKYEERQFLFRAFSVVDRVPADRARIGFTLARALEDDGEYSEAFDVLTTSNALQRTQVTWDRAKFRHMIDAVLAPERVPSPRIMESTDAGHGVVFIAAMPRSGSSLVEHVLGSHPKVSAARETDYLMRVIDAESRRTRLSYEAWAVRTGVRRWQRLGQQYLGWWGLNGSDHCWRVDKGMTNWLLVGSIIRMLPAARIVICHRNPIETCLGCFRQYFGQNGAFTYTMEEVAEYCNEFEQLTNFWEQKYPNNVFALKYESLINNHRLVIRELLDFCGLPFSEACMTPEHSERLVLNQPSAAQVRQPIRGDTAREVRYGARLQPLRDLLSI